MNLDYADIIKLLVALVLGAIIGAEREYRNKSAGFRTIILICMGSTLFTILSIKIGGNQNPDRIAANIITGIGFLGAGAIFRDDNKMTGITTATTIWVSAAIGMAIGAGFFVLATLVTLLVLFILYAFIKLQSTIDRANQNKKYKIVCPFEEETLHHYEALFKKHHLHSHCERQSIVNKEITGVWEVQGAAQNHANLVKELFTDASIKELDF